jgi:hypothetical protein
MTANFKSKSNILKIIIRRILEFNADFKSGDKVQKCFTKKVIIEQNL